MLDFYLLMLTSLVPDIFFVLLLDLLICLPFTLLIYL